MSSLDLYSNLRMFAAFDINGVLTECWIAYDTWEDEKKAYSYTALHACISTYTCASALVSRTD